MVHGAWTAVLDFAYTDMREFITWQVLARLYCPSSQGEVNYIRDFSPSNWTKQNVGFVNAQFNDKATLCTDQTTTAPTPTSVLSPQTSGPQANAATIITATPVGILAFE